MESIVINGKLFTHEAILADTVTPKTDFEKNTIAFCKAWLKGNSTFQLTTSGSTGTPKTITFTRKQMESSANMTAKALGLKKGYTSLVCLDTQYIAGRMMLVRSLVVGMNIIAVEPSSNPLANLGNENKIDFAAFVPYQLNNIVKQNPELLNQIKVVIVGGGEIDSSLNESLQSFRNSLYATYGMTETVSHIALMKLNGRDKQNLFNALPGINLKIDDQSCLIIEAPFLDEPVQTHDRVELISDREFKWLGRIDNIINSGGVKIVPEEVESALRALFNSLGRQNRFFIAGIPDTALGQKTCLFVEGEHAPDKIVNELRQKIKEQIPRFEVPKDIRFVKNFVETKTGKINRKETINLSSAKFQ